MAVGVFGFMFQAAFLVVFVAGVAPVAVGLVFKVIGWVVVVVPVDVRGVAVLASCPAASQVLWVLWVLWVSVVSVVSVVSPLGLRLKSNQARRYVPAFLITCTICTA